MEVESSILSIGLVKGGEVSGASLLSGSNSISKLCRKKRKNLLQNCSVRNVKE
jgi:hypothetical protein